MTAPQNSHPIALALALSDAGCRRTLSYLIKKRGMRIKEVQVEMAERIAGESYLNLRNSARYMTRMAFSVLFVQFFR